MIIILILIIIIILLYDDYKEIENISNKLINRKVDIDQCLLKNTRQYCKTIFPDTYRIYKSLNELDQLKKNYNKDDYFILKTIWGQERRGLKVVNYSNLNQNTINNYEQIQKIIPSLKINNRIFHIRLYLIIDKQLGNYLYNNGIVIYSKKNNNKIDNDNIITASLKTGYQNLDFYNKNNLPKTLIELYSSLDNNTSQLLKNNITTLFKKYLKLKDLNNNKIIMNETYYKHIFGPDLIIDSNYNCYILEVNQNPDLGLRNNKQLVWQTKIKSHLLKNYKKNNYSKDFTKL